MSKHIPRSKCGITADGKASELPVGDPIEYAAEKLMLEYFRAIRRQMRVAGITQVELAERLGVSQAYISKILRYNQNVTIRTLAMLAEAMGVEWETPRLHPIEEAPAAITDAPYPRAPRDAAFLLHDAPEEEE